MLNSLYSKVIGVHALSQFTESQFERAQVVASKDTVVHVQQEKTLNQLVLVSQRMVLLAVVGNVSCLRVIISFYHMKQCDVKDHLVSVVPGVQRSFSGIIVKHGDVKVLVVEGNVYVFIR